MSASINSVWRKLGSENQKLQLDSEGGVTAVQTEAVPKLMIESLQRSNLRRKYYS